MEKKTLRKGIYAMAIILILSLFLYGGISFVIIPQNEESLESLKNELNSLTSEINQTDYEINVNGTILNQLQSGDNYTLHDPLFEEIINFIENDTASSVKVAIDNAKKIGLRCAFIEVVILNLNVYELIGFNTADQEMVYFEIETDYQVIPKINQYYSNCVVGTPYAPTYDDFIVDILEIW
jgi:hypothetical protein